MVTILLRLPLRWLALILFDYAVAYTFPLPSSANKSSAGALRFVQTERCFLAFILMARPFTFGPCPY